MINFIGTGSAFNTELGNNNAFIQQGNHFILIDCGSSTFERIMKYKLLDGFDKISVLITHLHPDHVGSLGDLIFYAYYILKQNVSIYFPKPQDIETYLNAVGVGKELYRLSELEERGHVQFGTGENKLNISPVRTRHVDNLNCYGYFISMNNEHIYYSGDASIIPDEVLKGLKDDWLSRIYQDTCKVDYDGNVHLSLRKLCGLIPVELRNKIYCMHYDNGLSKDELHELGFQTVSSTSIRLRSLVDKLFSANPNEKIIQSLKGEVMIPKDRIKNFIPNLKNSKDR